MIISIILFFVLPTSNNSWESDVESHNDSVTTAITTMIKTTFPMHLGTLPKSYKEKEADRKMEGEFGSLKTYNF